MVFIKRKIIPRIRNFLDYKKVIVIYGARQVGKTIIVNYPAIKARSPNGKFKVN